MLEDLGLRLGFHVWSEFHVRGGLTAHVDGRRRKGLARPVSRLEDLGLRLGFHVRSGLIAL